MKSISYVEAVKEALYEEMARDKNVFLMGEDVGVFGGLWGTSRGLLDAFGPNRVIDTPISENSIVGVAIGAALAGLRPIVEIMFSDLLYLAMDQICNHAAKLRYMFGGQCKVPIVVRTLDGTIGSAAQHSSTLAGWFMHVPGLKVAVPGTPYDVKGLLKAAIRDDNPVLFFEHKMLLGEEGEVPENDYVIPFGKANVCREGNDVTIIAWQLMLKNSLSAAEYLDKEGISVEIIDPRTLVPLDKETLIKSVKKTGKVVIVEEGCKTGGAAAEIAAIIAEEAFDHLDKPIRRIAGPDIPVPSARWMDVVPTEEQIIKAVKELVRSE